MHPLVGRLIVNFVLCLICFIAYSSQIFIIWPWYGRVISVELLTLLVPFNLLVWLLLWNYFLCVYTDPGRVPSGWQPDTNADGYEVKRLTGAPRYCRMCKNYKPPRAHHCRACNRCVLRMDHHCPWINNCVGHFNYAHFIRFLFFVDVACSYHLAMVTRRVMYSMGATYWDEPSTLELVMIITNYVACLPVIFSVGIFSIFHFNSLLGNTTTIEGWEKDKAAIMVRKGKMREIKFPYDLGRRRNIQSVLGKNPLLWCCPTRTPGSGLSYELTDAEGESVYLAPRKDIRITSNEDYVRHEWPPKEDLNFTASSDPNEQKSGALQVSSPWTYENGLNPTLRPTNTELRSRRRRRRLNGFPGSSAVPPYHPDHRASDLYALAAEEYHDTVSSDEEFPQAKKPFVRRGSEGYEVRQEGREDMLRRYLAEIGEDPNRYQRYIPQSGEDSGEDSDDDVPLSYHQERFPDGTRL